LRTARNHKLFTTPQRARTAAVLFLAKEQAMPATSTKKVASPILTDATLPIDPELRAIADDVLAKLRLSFTAAAAEDQPAASGDVDKLFRKFLATRSAPTRTRVQQKARTLLKATPQMRRQHFGRYAAIDVKDFAAVGTDGIDKLVRPLKVDSAALKKSIEKVQSHVRVGFADDDKVKINGRKGREKTRLDAGDIDTDALAGSRYKKLELYIRKVRCKEETSELSDSDEINLGGVIIGATGNTVLVDQFKVSHDFDAGEVKDFGFSKKFGDFTIRRDSTGFPYVYTAVIAMAEKDEGGFYDFLKALVESIAKTVSAMVPGAAGAALGALLGSPGGPIFVAIGAVVGGLIGWIITMLEDDIIGTHTVQIGLGSAKKSYYDWAKLTTSEGLEGTLTYKGDGGHYKLEYSWKVA
jgi:hypothetical protein